MSESDDRRPKTDQERFQAGLIRKHQREIGSANNRPTDQTDLVSEGARLEQAPKRTRRTMSRVMEAFEGPIEALPSK